MSSGAMTRFDDDAEPVRFDDCEGRRQTAKALLVHIPDLGRDVWVPQSVIDDDSEVYEEGGSGELVIADWWARKEGLV